MIKKLFIVVHILCLLVLLITNAVPYLSPVDYSYLPILGLGYPITIITCLVMLIVSLLIKSKIYWVNMIICLGSIIHLHSFFSFGINSNNTDEDSFKISSYNVRLFDRYKWLEDETNAKQKIFKYLDSIDSDIYCFQEFYYEEKQGEFNTVKQLSKLLECKYERGLFSHHMTGGNHFGLQVFSKHEIIQSGEINFKNDPNNGAIYIDLLKGKDTIRVYNMHLGSIRFQNEDYKVFGDKTEFYKNSKSTSRILGRLNTAYAKRAEQVAHLLAHAERGPKKVIFCGDINDTPTSYAYHQLSQGKKDAFLQHRFGLGTTYSGKIPANRIDYILYSKDLETEGFEIQDAILSDHKAITAYFK